MNTKVFSLVHDGKPMNESIGMILEKLNIHPVLVDIGSSGKPPEIWDKIARHSIYVGFDPDLRESHELPKGSFHKGTIVNEAITSQKEEGEALFYFTKSPDCSSTLKPDSESLANFIFSDLFTVEKRAKVRATTLGSAMDRLSLSGIDWLKVDSQGTDLRIFNSIKDEIRSKVLAVDIEPGLIDAYHGEDLFVDAHRNLVRNGFWLSNLNICGTARMKKSTLSTIMSVDKNVNYDVIEKTVRQSPCWCEARYLRTLESLSVRTADSRRFALLWVFAMMERQWGYALDIACAYEQRFAQDGVFSLLRDLPLRLIIQKNQNVRSIVKRFLPRRFKQFLRQLV